MPSIEPSRILIVLKVALLLIAKPPISWPTLAAGRPSASHLSLSSAPNSIRLPLTSFEE